MPQYRKKPVIIQAWQWNETETMRQELVQLGMNYCGSSGHRDRPDECTNLTIRTLESKQHRVELGDFIICGVRGEFYSCKPDIFEATYEKVSSPPPPEAVGEKLREATLLLNALPSAVVGEAEIVEKILMMIDQIANADYLVLSQIEQKVSGILDKRPLKLTDKLTLGEISNLEGFYGER